MIEAGQEEPEIKLLKEWLPKISSEYRAYIKGASEALLYAQEEAGVVAAAEAGGKIACMGCL